MASYAIPIFDGRGKLKNPTHEKFGIKTVGVEEYLRSNPNLWGLYKGKYKKIPNAIIIL